MKITYLGHACIHVEINGYKLLFDPFISPNELAKDIDIHSIECDYILISHGHLDHLKDAEVIAINNEATIISNFEIVSWYEEKKIKGHPMNIGGQWLFDFGKVRYVNAVHSSVLPDGTYGGNPGGFVIESKDGNFYFAGDTALTYDMKLIPLICAPLDFCILPIGDNFTMGIEDALLASNFVNCSNIVGCHYDTFGYIKINKENALDIFTSGGKKLFLPLIGKSIDI